MSSLKNKAINGIKWSFINNLAHSGITFLVGIVLARLLTPAEFGTLGLIMVFIAVFNIIIDGGFVTALIRKPDASDEDYNTVFFCNIGVSLFFMLLLCLCSQTIADFFNEPILRFVTPVMSLLLLIYAFAIIQQTILVKKLAFKVQTKISLIASFGSGFIGIGMAFMNFGIWSLVGQQLSRQLLLTTILWFSSSWKPKWLFSKQSFEELLGFGWKILVGNLINTFYKNIFMVVIGKMYSTAQLGLYNRAEQFNLILTENLSSVILKVSFPVFSQIQNDKDRMMFLFRKTLIYSSIITFSSICGLAAVAKPLILVLVGEKWLESVKYLQIMCCYGVLYPLQQLNVIILSVYGRSDLLLKLEVLKKLIFIPVLFVGYYFDLTSMLWAAVVYYYIEFVANSWYSERFFGYGTWKQAKDLFPILLLSTFIAICMWCVTLLSIPSIFVLILQCLVGLSLFIGVYEWTSQTEYIELKNIVKNDLVHLLR